MDDLAIRKAEPKDSEFAYNVKKAAFEAYVEKAWGWDENEQQQLHKKRFDTQDFRIICWDGKNIGIMAVIVQPDCLKLNQLFLLPEFQRRGIGRKCVRQILEEANQLCVSVRLRVLKVNPQAQTFFQRLDFVHTGEIDRHVLMEYSLTK